jgi:hypothetical protein
MPVARDISGRPAIVLDNRVRLVGLPVVEAVRGCSAQTIFNEVDRGGYLWTWDFALSANAHRRELRFWIGEIPNPKEVSQCAIEQIIDEILPRSRAFFSSGDLYVRFAIAKSTLTNLRRELGVKAGVIYRAPLVEFLRRRWLGVQGGMRGK